MNTKTSGDAIQILNVTQAASLHGVGDPEFATPSAGKTPP